MMANQNLTQRRPAGGGQPEAQKTPPTSTTSWEISQSGPPISGGGLLASGAISSRDGTPIRNHPQHYNYQNGAKIEDNNMLFKRKGGGGSDHHGARNRLRLFERTRLEDYHTVFRKPHHVADNQYQKFINGGRRGKRQRSIITRDCCARGCSFFSIIAALFLFMVGFLLDRQPLYIKGTLPAQMVQSKQKSGKFVVQYLLPPTSTSQNQQSLRLPMARVAYRAGWAYLFTALACMYILHRGWIQSQYYKFSNKYEDIPDHVSDAGASDAMSTLPTFHTPSPFRRNVDDVDADDAAAAAQAYEQQHAGGMSQTMARLWHWLAHRGWYQPQPRYRRKRDPKMVWLYIPDSFQLLIQLLFSQNIVNFSRAISTMGYLIKTCSTCYSNFLPNRGASKFANTCELILTTFITIVL